MIQRTNYFNSQKNNKKTSYKKHLNFLIEKLSFGKINSLALSLKKKRNNSLPHQKKKLSHERKTSTQKTQLTSLKKKLSIDFDKIKPLKHKKNSTFFRENKQHHRRKTQLAHEKKLNPPKRQMKNITLKKEENSSIITKNISTFKRKKLQSLKQENSILSWKLDPVQKENRHPHR